MSIGTTIYTWLYGKIVGTDEIGNKYYTNSENHNDLKAKRWVIFNGEIEFHGEKKPIKVLGSIDDSNKKIKVEGKFQIIPSEFKISLPSFMLIEMEDYLDISFSLYFDK